MWPLYFLAGINFIAFCAFGVDKFCAIRQKQRIPEATLLALCLLGGALGAAVGMILFHHKVSKPKFRYSVPALFIFYLIAIFMIMREVIL